MDRGCLSSVICTGRRLQQLFTLSTHWKAYDIFHATKTTALRSSRRAIIELATHFKAITQSLSSSSFPSEEDREKAALLLFQEVSLISLWGNATDLSLLPDLSHSALQKLQGAAARQASAGNLLANDLPAAFEVLRGLQKAGKPRRVDIVLDNAGFELYVDLVLAAYLLVAGLADSVILRPKSMPWFVSDVVAADLYGLLNALADPAFFGDDVAEAEAADLRFLFEKLSVLHAEGQMILRPDAFWTSAHSFWRLPSQAPDLWGDLKDAALVVFKGDLNYRKLVGDVMWPPTTPFSEAIGPLNEGLRVLALRTCKGDVVVGLPEGRDEELRHTEGAAGQFDEEAKKDDKARRWAWCGKWAVVQFADGKGGE
ncbi:DUF89-domain-containing protein [Trichodelitschia bisporula]|uniref:Sugar phosphate phosphatase n=1 Tax=Trichodelitschia bisporula TaxID=703511 RepID=A0A6G1I9Q4_9PEZI|nr:DUF89-domain-containing protein [Trichodelitschia bisporula]